jgi:hypothetical protein
MKDTFCLFVLLAACGAPLPSAQLTFITRGLSAADVKTVDLYLLDVSGAGRAKTCTDLGTQLIPARDDVVVFSHVQLVPTQRATIEGLADGEWLIVAEAFTTEAGVGPPVGRGCASVPPIYKDSVTSLTLTIEALP